MNQSTKASRGVTMVFFLEGDEFQRGKDGGQGREAKPKLNNRPGTHYRDSLPKTISRVFAE